jgi:glycosyltransferase involved in cell wall biosynthesis
LSTVGPLVSIITPVRNGMPFVAEMIESVRRQDYPHVEHIAVDGGSTDGTLDVLRHSDGLIWVSEPDRGMYDAINRGFRMARGEIVAYQNADDRYVVPGAISTAAQHLREHPEVDVVFGSFRYIDEGGTPISGPQPAAPVDLRALRRCNVVPPHATFVRRAVVEQGHWLDPELQFAGDWDWLLGMSEAGRRFAQLPAVLSEFRLHPRSKTSRAGWRLRLREWRRICRRHGISLPVLVWYETFYAPLRRRLGLPI